MVKIKKVIQGLKSVGKFAAIVTGAHYSFGYNRHNIDKNIMRSRQPSEAFIQRLHENEGLASVLSLRGETGIKPYQDYTTANNIIVYPIPIRMKKAPSREALGQIVDVVSDPTNYPLLIHCQAGIDRSGFAATVYELTQGKTVSEAKKQMNIWHGHIRYCPLDQIIDTYQAEGEAHGMDFETWVDNNYHPEEFKQMSA